MKLNELNIIRQQYLRLMIPLIKALLFLFFLST